MENNDIHHTPYTNDGIKSLKSVKSAQLSTKKSQPTPAESLGPRVMY